VLVTGDITHGGRVDEYARFEAVVAPLRRRGALVAVPGNHDRLGSDVGRFVMGGERVDVVRRDGLYLIRMDSTGPHNRYVFASHGLILDDDLAALERALDAAPEHALVAVAMHHHPLPLPTETMSEHVSDLLGLPFADELAAGRALLRRLAGRCDLLLHGHRHAPREFQLFASTGRTLHVLNAGASGSMGRARIFAHSAGRRIGPARWLRPSSTLCGRDLELVTSP
jgi:3',5'-cyclic AMP phosphodiesterase CpdA